jgi:hypothetical protein
MVLVGLLSLGCMACERHRVGDPVAIEETSRAPVVTSADEAYAGVFEPLDGVWRGRFEVWVDSGGQPNGPAKPREFDLDQIAARESVTLQTTIDVTQTYVSESPYFQRVSIVDRYEDGRVVESSGVNKVQDGMLWCVVDKPDDLVVHRGEFVPEHTIIWSRDRTSPKAIEYFREVVEADVYTIEGWGYYGSDDPSRAPRMWFRSRYERQ